VAVRRRWRRGRAAAVEAARCGGGREGRGGGGGGGGSGGTRTGRATARVEWETGGGGGRLRPRKQHASANEGKQHVHAHARQHAHTATHHAHSNALTPHRHARNLAREQASTMGRRACGSDQQQGSGVALMRTREEMEWKVDLPRHGLTCHATGTGQRSVRGGRRRGFEGSRSGGAPRRRGGGGSRPKPTQMSPQTAPSGAAWGNPTAPLQQIQPRGSAAVGTCVRRPRGGAAVGT